jgi:hypothetical protein
MIELVAIGAAHSLAVILREIGGTERNGTPWIR